MNNIEIIQDIVTNAEFALIPVGTFLMGSPENENCNNDCGDEKQHAVILTRDFYMQTTPVTQRQWQTIMGKNPSYFNDGNYDRPVETVSWHNCKKFVIKLNQQSNNQYRLPTEAEWEYACRAGSLTPFSCGDSLNASQANFNNNNEQTTPVKSYPANAFGLYDMHGNVWEWCLDAYSKNIYSINQTFNPVCVNNKRINKIDDIYKIELDNIYFKNFSFLNRVIRGGGWCALVQHCRSAYRNFSLPSRRNSGLGFRLVRIKEPIL
jgi:formylglycine-generating enzyme required for sulfatase activity